MHLLLSVELGETTPRQRTILRRELHEQGWKLVSSGFMFTNMIRNLKSDDEAVELVTEQLKRALTAAEITDWGADCFIKSRTKAQSDRRLKPLP